MTEWRVFQNGAVVQLKLDGKVYDLPLHDARAIAQELDQQAIAVLRFQGHLPQKAVRDRPGGDVA